MRMEIVSRTNEVDIAISAVVVGNRSASLDIAVYLHVAYKSRRAIPRQRPVERPCRGGKRCCVRSIERNSPVGRDHDRYTRGRIDADVLRLRRIRHALRLRDLHALLYLTRVDAVSVRLCYFARLRDDDTGSVREHDTLVPVQV